MTKREKELIEAYIPSPRDYNEINGGYYLTVRMYKKPAPKRSGKRGTYARE